MSKKKEISIRSGAAEYLTFVAATGEQANKHHFAHQSNYECVYANEIAVYLFVKMVFASYHRIKKW